MVKRWRFGFYMAIGVAVVSLAAGVTSVNYNFARNNPGGNDFLTRWVATRSFLLEGLSPYSDQVATQIQVIAYGRPANTDEDEMRMAYPLYAVLLFVPFALIDDYEVARAVWMTTLEVGIGLISLLSAQLVAWKPSRVNVALFILFTALGYHSVRPIINGNVVVLVMVFMVAALLALRRDSDLLAGAMLAWTTIKPQLALLFIAGIFVWAISHRRWKVIVSTAGWIIGLTAIGMLFVPNWLMQNLAEVVRYSEYTPAGTPQDALQELWPQIGVWPGRLLTLGLTIWLLWEWQGMWGKPFERFLRATCVTLVVSQWIGIQTDPGNFIILILPLLLVFAQAQERWGTWASIGIGVTMLVLLFGLWILFILTLEIGDQPMQSPVMFFPLPALILLGFWLTQTIGKRSTNVGQEESSSPGQI